MCIHCVNPHEHTFPRLTQSPFASVYAYVKGLSMVEMTEVTG